MRLFGYWRSSATYRVRIVLNLKGLAYDYTPVNLLAGEQNEADHRARQPQGLVPALEDDDGAMVVQSLAIAEYLEETRSAKPILPEGAAARAAARAIAASIACEGQPFMNLRVQRFLKNDKGFDDDAMADWLNRWAGGALDGVEAMAARHGGDFCVGDRPGLAEAFLIPQMFASRRFGVDVDRFAKLVEIEARCAELDAFQRARPERQPDAP
ncbi:MAG: maleylacetoacetate isomerase [Parvularculaceae bacterium]